MEALPQRAELSKDKESFAQKYALNEYWGKPEAAALAAGLLPDRGPAYLLDDEIMERVIEIREAAIKRLPLDKLKVLERLASIIEDGKDAEVIRAATVYGKMLGWESIPAAPLTDNRKVVNNNFFGGSAGDADEIEARVRNGEDLKAILAEKHQIPRPKGPKSAKPEDQLTPEQLKKRLACRERKRKFDAKKRRILAKMKEAGQA